MSRNKKGSRHGPQPPGPFSAAWLQGWNQPSYPLHTALNGSAGNEGEPGVGCRELIVAAATGDVDRQRRGGCGRPRERQHGIRVCRDSPESRSRSLACAVSRSTGPVSSNSSAPAASRLPATAVAHVSTSPPRKRRRARPRRGVRRPPERPTAPPLERRRNGARPRQIG